MARFRDMSNGWRIATIVLIVILAVVATICVVAGVKAAQEDIGFFEALSDLFGVAGKTAQDAVENAGDTAGEVGDAVTAALKSM